MRRLRWLLPLVLIAVGSAIVAWPRPTTPPPRGGTPRRIVCLAPALTETVFALGVGDRVVGRTEWCTWPPEASRVPVVGGMGQPDLEHVIALCPDLVLAPALGRREDYERLRRAGLRVEELDPGTLADVLSTIRRIGSWLETGPAAEGVVARIEAERDRVAKAVAGRPRIRAAFVVGHDPLFVSGKGTFADDLLSMAGAENACGDVSGWERYGMEDFLARDPGVILDSTMGKERDSDAALVAFWDRWKGLAAVKAGRVKAIDADLTNRPGPRIGEALGHLARLLHPEAFEPAAEGER